MGRPGAVRYRVLVRRYRCRATNRLVQSPNVDLRTKCPKIIIRPIRNDTYKADPEIYSDSNPAPELIDDDESSKVHCDDAHGVYFSFRDGTVSTSPVWARLNKSDLCEENNEAYVLDLDSWESFAVSITRICWVPTHKLTDGSFYTIIGSPGQMGHDKNELMLPAVIQREYHPEETRYDSLPVSRLPQLPEASTFLKEAFLEKQSNVIRQQYLSRSRTSDPRQSTVAHQKQIQSRLLFGQPNIPTFVGEIRRSGTASSSGAVPGLIPGSASEVASYRQASRGTQDSWQCTCRYSDLGPTLWTLRPRHRHVKDDECPLGPSHGKHCIFASHRPDHCVIPSSGEAHEHCPRAVPTPSEEGSSPPSSPEANSNIDKPDNDDDKSSLQQRAEGPEAPELSAHDLDVLACCSESRIATPPPDDLFSIAQMGPEDLGPEDLDFTSHGPGLDTVAAVVGIRVDYRIRDSPDIPEMLF